MMSTPKLPHSTSVDRSTKLASTAIFATILEVAKLRTSNPNLNRPLYTYLKVPIYIEYSGGIQ